MSSAKHSRIQFVNITSSGNGGLTNTQRRQARSHSARETHARARRRRIEKQQPSSGNQPTGEVFQAVEYHEEVRIVPSDGSPIASSPPKDAEWCRAANVPSPVSLLSSDRRDPFACFALPLKPIDHFLLDYYVRVVIPDTDVNCFTRLKDEYQNRRMLLRWTQLSLTDVGFFCGILLAACRHLFQRQPLQRPRLTHLAIQYKLACLRSLIATNMERASSVHDSTIGQILMLAQDEMSLGDAITSRLHVLGAVNTTELKGGPQTLGLDGFLKLVLYNFMYNNGFFSTNPCSYEIFAAKMDLS